MQSTHTVKDPWSQVERSTGGRQSAYLYGRSRVQTVSSSGPKRERRLNGGRSTTRCRTGFPLGRLHGHLDGRRICFPYTDGFTGNWSVRQIAAVEAISSFSASHCSAQRLPYRLVVSDHA